MTSSRQPTVQVRRFEPLGQLRFVLVIAVGFTLLAYAISADRPEWATAGGWASSFAATFFYAAVISLTVNGLFFGLDRLLGARMQRLTTWQQRAHRWITPLVGVLLGNVIATLLMWQVVDPTGVSIALRTTRIGALIWFLIVMALFYGYFEIRGRQQRAERRATEAQLRLLQAQMEPHFLFNTLANVLGLMEVDVPRARAMLESFTDYLRASLGGMREAEHPLGAELELIEAYLRVVAIRMDDRLHYRIDVPAELRSQRMPALSLQPLVENAIVHGLEPSVVGGSVAIEAAREGDRLVIRVTDDGLGLQAPRGTGHRGTGTALANIRERLRQGNAGRLELADHPPHGTCATLTLPFVAMP